MTITPGSPADEFIKTVLWIAPYGECFHCSTRTALIPARYEAWFTMSGDMLLDAYNQPLAPHTECHTLCEECMASVREDNGTPKSTGIMLVKARTL